MYSKEAKYVFLTQYIYTARIKNIFYLNWIQKINYFIFKQNLRATRSTYDYCNDSPVG